MFSKFKNDNGRWWLDFLPDKGKTFGRPSRTAYALPENRSDYYSFRVNTDVYGYAFTNSNSEMKSSTIVLILYLPTVIVFLFWSLMVGVTSASWDCLSELLILALKSPPPPEEVTVGSSAGVSTLRPLKERYWIVNTGEQLVFKLSRGEKCPEEERVKISTV
ncbi:uncharacterized protein CTRU02_214694 [Colletotrichum truncatum]|uniref:Uncharacterized protein n=1 Tax=Colletotrichum truncatum TaxID=5467 RepID=A0ACC3YFF7_COLTU